MNKLASDVQIGDLLRGAGLLTVSDLTHAAQVASKTSLPVGRVLVMLGLLTPEVVHAAVQGQALVRDRLIERDAAVKALCVVSAQRVTFDQALKQIGFLPEVTVQTNTLGDLLLSAELVTQEQLADATNTSQHLSLPLGRILVLKAALSEEMLESAMETMMLLRAAQINRVQAIDALRTMRLSGCRTGDALLRLGCEASARSSTSILGELFVVADLVSRTDLLTALEIGLIEEQPLGRVLIDFGFITQYILDSAVRLQKAMSNKHLTMLQTAEGLKLIANCGFNLVQALNEVMEPEVRQNELLGLLHLLSSAGLVNTEDCQRLLKFRGTSIFKVVLTESGLMNETTLSVAVRCYFLMTEGFLTSEQAVVALHHWRWSGISLNDILQTMGWETVEKSAPVEELQLEPTKPQPEKLAAAAAAAAEPEVPIMSNLSLSWRLRATEEDLEEMQHHTWGVPQVHHSWGAPEVHHSWH